MRRRSIFPIEVTSHARERARERCPGFKAARIIDEVHDGLLACRFSAKRPLWCPDPSGRGDIALFVWTPDRERVYPLVLNDFDRGESFRVVTTLVGEPTNEQKGRQ